MFGFRLWKEGIWRGRMRNSVFIGSWKDGRERESLASATSTGAPMAGIDTNGFDKDEIVRVLAGQLSTVAAMADSANIEQLNIQVERHANEPEPDVPSVVTPDFLEVHTTECLNMSFGGFGEVEDQHADLYGVLKLGLATVKKRHCIEKHAPCKDDCPLGVASNSMHDGLHIGD
ncbi:hypothetical protein Tco_0074160 [Tanacetum coccineum]